MGIEKLTKEEDIFQDCEITQETLELAKARGWLYGIQPQRVVLKWLRAREVYIGISGSKSTWSYQIMCNRPNFLDIEALSNFDLEFRKYNFNLRFEDPESATEDAIQQAMIRCPFRDEVIPE